MTKKMTFHSILRAKLIDRQVVYQQRTTIDRGIIHVRTVKVNITRTSAISTVQSQIGNVVSSMIDVVFGVSKGATTYMSAYQEGPVTPVTVMNIIKACVQPHSIKGPHKDSADLQEGDLI